MAKEKKSIKFQLRLTKAQSAMLERQAAEAGMTKTRYVTYLIEREEKAKRAVLSPDAKPEGRRVVIVYKDADLRKLMWHLAKWGTNLNQATRALNALLLRKSLSERKSQELLGDALARIELSEVAITRIAGSIDKLQDERHVVMGD